ncbi:MAG: translation elongation factor Ts [Acidobacteria bacterium]|jgi:elongation factor Ts|uniref:Elongation factor Ts n=1 Tax=Candidatus Polarisedimenticola svalbardensis TaxID=2886004 RepID=A0A8J7C1U5_9BACT|nr:translation elongation factor Ts [Candidatus Polarisedimenticola svalbardensis]
MQISASLVKELREKTGVGMMACKRALTEAGGSLDEAEKILRKRGEATAAKKAGRAAGEGLIHSYIHTGSKVGVLLEVNCETDFTARNEDFQGMVKDIAMHIAAASPRFVSREDVPEEVVAGEREIFADQAKKTGKPENVIAKIVEGKIDKFYSEICLLEQPFVKDPDQNIQALLTERIARIGENMRVARFTRYVLGDS